MRDFLEELDRRLAVIAQEHPELSPLPEPEPRRARRRPAKLAALSAVIATAAATFTMTGTSLAELPILATPTKDVSALSERAKGAAEAGVDFSKAHPFGTPGGPGYALVNEQTQTLCIAIPDPRSPGDYGVSCGTPLSTIEREGLKAEMVGDVGQDPSATTLVAFVLPEGADNARLSTTPPGATLAVESGVAVVETPSETNLVWTVDGVRQSELIEGPFPANGGVQVSCADGTAPYAPLPPEGATRLETRSHFRAARKRLCKE